MWFAISGPRPSRRSMCCWLILAALLPASVAAKPQYVPPPELEQAIGRASLILVARVAAVRETTVVQGGKGEWVLRTFEFEPVAELKGIYAREVLALTSQDLGSSLWTPESGELRLLLLGRSETGYYNVHHQPSLDRAVPLVESAADPLVKSVELLIGLTQEPDRVDRIERLLKGSETIRGAGAVPLLESLAYRSLLAAQYPGVDAITRHLEDASPAVRIAAARTLGAILKADYLENDELAQDAVTRLVGLLETADPVLAARVAALDAIAMTPWPGVPDVAPGQFRRGFERSTWAEQAAFVELVGRQQLNGFTDQLLALAGELELDAVEAFERAVQAALIRLDPERAARLLERRIRDKHVAGLEAAVEIRLAGELPVDEAVSVLTAVPVHRLSQVEARAFAAASQQVKDRRLIPQLAELLDPRRAQLHRHVVDALRGIDTAEAAQALRPFLPQEASIHDKLEIGEFLGRHGIDTGLPYALEHMSQPHLLEPSLAVLRAVASPESVETLRGIVRTSNDVAWTGAAIRGLGVLGDRQLAPQLFAIVEDLRHPLAPYALVALGQVGEPEAIAVLRRGIRSRDDRIVAASIQGAAALMKRREIDDASLRDEMAGLLASADASAGVRAAALDALRELDDRRLDAALAAAVLDAGLEGEALLGEIEELLRVRKIGLGELALAAAD